MESQVCSKCKVEKPFSEYHKRSANKNGLKGTCKECCSKGRRDWYRNQTQVEKQIRNIATNILHRTNGTATKKYYFDKGIECRIGKNLTEIMDYLRENFAEDIQAMLDSGEQVSIDRIESKGHYEHGNLRIMEFGENALRGSVSGGKTTRESHGHVIFIKDIETGKTTKAPSRVAAAEVIGCSRPAIDLYFKRNGSTPIFGRYEIKRESE